MNNQPKVSVVVAVYNAEKFLEKCLDSIKNQTLKNIEVLCVDDGSTDSSSEILKRFSKNDSRFHIFRKENEGLGGASARNYGLDRANGEFVSILDSDDFFEPVMLEHAVKKAEATEADIVVFGGFEHNDKNDNTYKVDSILNEKVIPQKDVFDYRDCSDKIYQLSQGMAWNKLYRKKFLDKHGIRFQKIKYTDDAFFTFANMILAKKITVLREYLCYYRVNSGVNQTAGMDNYPDSSYLPYVMLKDFLIEQNAWQTVERSFVNCVTAFMRYCYDNMTSFDSFAFLHDKFRNEIFSLLAISGKEKEFFYDERLWLWVRQVQEHSAGELAFMAARAHGSDATTGILRFQFPYEKLPRECKIVLIGAGIMGRHFYSQLMLSGYCDVVLWAEQENPFGLSYIHKLEEVRNCEFDYAVIAYVQPRLIRPALDMLNDMGIEKSRIILGGDTL